MDLIERIDNEMKQGFDQLKQLEVGSAAYNEVLKTLKDLENMKQGSLRSDLDRELDERKVRIEEISTRNSAAEEAEKIENEKKVKLLQILEKVASGVSMAVAVFFIVKGEQTQVISSKSIDIFSRIKNTISR